MPVHEEDFAGRERRQPCQSGKRGRGDRVRVRRPSAMPSTVIARSGAADGLSGKREHALHQRHAVRQVTALGEEAARAASGGLTTTSSPT